ncbi:MAG TPA: hypothetical protein VGP68_06340 [Gemmataceae bacterium]|jgi:hypothetical protein|nr:hypothetical protein [Gemmataceae bacterium]
MVWKRVEPGAQGGRRTAGNHGGATLPCDALARNTSDKICFFEIGAGQGGVQPGATAAPAAYIYAELNDAEAAIVSMIKAIRYE